MTVEVGGIALGRRGDTHLERRLAAAEDAPHSYDHHGSTLDPAADPGVPLRCWDVEAEGTVASAAAALRRWEAHDGIRARIVPPGAPIAVGTTLLVVAPFGPLEMAVPNRIVAVVDEPDRFGFVYGTLVGHAEVGEELFLAEAVGPGRVRLSVRVHARPGTSLARLGAPVVRGLQAGAARRYLASWAAAIQRGEGG